MSHAAARASARAFTQDYASFTAGLQAAALPSGVVTAAKLSLCDTLAGATAGSGAPGVDAVVALVRSFGGASQATIWGRGARVPAHEAAWVNAMMAHAGDFDDTDDEAAVQAGVAVMPAALAAAELDAAASGADLLAAIVAGLELVCRLGLATTVSVAESGFAYTSLFGYFGAAAAAARVLRLDAAQTANAIALAYSQAAGAHGVTRGAADAKHLQPGFAARAGVLSAQLAQRGIGGAQEVFEGSEGLFRTYLRGQFDAEKLGKKLGAQFACLGLGHKPYPCCRFTHTAIDAALALRARIGFDPARIRRIDARVNRRAYEAVCTPAELRRIPTTVLQAQFSLPYCAAAALLDGTVGPTHFTEAALRRPELVMLARRVDCRVDGTLDRQASPTVLRVETSSGVLVERVEVARAPQTPADFSAYLSEPVRQLVSGLETLSTARQLLDCF